jgi:ankyrin repeat protein
LAVVQVLINASADVNVRDTKTYEGWTPLHFASAFGRTVIVRALLKTKQDPHVLNTKDQTPFDLASSQEIKELLSQDQLMRNRQGEFAPLLDKQPVPQPEYIGEAPINPDQVGVSSLDPKHHDRRHKSAKNHEDYWSRDCFLVSCDLAYFESLSSPLVCVSNCFVALNHWIDQDSQK